MNSYTHARATQLSKFNHWSPDQEDEVDHNEQNLLVANRSKQIIVLPENATRADAIFILSKDIPQNEFGLPIMFYRSDLLASANLGCLSQEDVDAAGVGLFYHDGFPTLDTGQSFWTQLPHEHYNAYILFTQYLEQAQDYGIRQLDMLAATANKDLDELQQLSREFYWSSRARAYDIFFTAAEQKRREYRIRKMENHHFSKIEPIMERLLSKFEDEEWIDELNAKEAIEGLETLIKLQRLSVGLTGQHASSAPKDGAPQGASGEFILRQITQSAGLTQKGADNMQSKLQALLDGGDGMIIQEAILRMNTLPSQQT